METALRAAGVVLAIGAAVAALTLLDGWDTFLDVTGLSDVGPKTVKTALDDQCDQIRDAYPDDVVGCFSQAEFISKVKAACEDEAVGTELDDFLIGKPGTTKTVHPRCPPR